MRSNLREVRANLSVIIDELSETGPVEITRYGKTVAILMPVGKTVKALQAAADPDQLTDEQVAKLEPVDMRVSPDLKVTRQKAVEPLKPFRELPPYFQPVPKPGTKK